MNYLDGFSGYGGFHLGFEQAGWKFDNCYFSEIDQHAIACYSHNFPNSIYAGSIDTICESGIITELDLFTFGWSCQDNSIAGKRKGQKSGTRSGLLYEAVNIIDKFRPRNFVAENVAGLLTVNKGIDIIKSLEILTFLNESCPQYDIEMQLLNTRWFLPQNRERLFFVGHLRGSGSRQIFPFGKEYGLSDPEWMETTTCISSLTATDYKGPSKQRPNFVIPVKSANKAGFEYAENGDSINLQNPNSKTRRGRIGKSIAQTLDTSGIYQHVFENNNIRKFTPTESERLQGLPDAWTKYGLYEGKKKIISDTQRYRLCGNGVSIPPVKIIAELLKY